MVISQKIFSDSYLYSKMEYERSLFNFLMNAVPIDKKSSAFEEIVYQIKNRQVNAVLSKVLESNKVNLVLSNKPNPRMFKVIYAKDIKDTNEKKVFIDCTGMIELKDGVYKCKNYAGLMSYIISAMTYILYYNIPQTIVNNSTLTEFGTEIFVDLMLYVLGYLKLPITFSNNKEKYTYSLAQYYQYCILGRNTDSVDILAKKISKLAPNEVNYVNGLFAGFYEEPNKITIDKYVDKFVSVFLETTGLNTNTRLDTSVLSEKWMYLFGPGTIFGLELFVPFASIITDCFVGGYINMQNTIEKIAGRKINTFTTELLKIGSENA